MAVPIKDYHKKDIFDILKTITPFSFLNEQILSEIVEKSYQKHYAKDSFIFQEGEHSKQTLFLILEGEAKALARLGSEESVATIRGKGEFFGVTGLLSAEPYPISMVASQALICLLINRDIFQKALASSNKFADYFTKMLASRLKDLYLTFADSRYEEQFFQGQSLRRRVADIAQEKVVTCLPMDKISNVAKKMQEARISSVVVVAFNGKPVGIITEKDLVHKVMATEKPDLDRRAHEVMSGKLITVKPDDFSYQALLMMTKHNIKHIVITDDNDVLHGIITVKDLIRNRNSGALSIIRQIEYQDSFDGLSGLIKEIDQVQQALLTERAFASEICSLTTELYDRITRRVIQIAEIKMTEADWGAPPADYCFINMGSAGRREQYSRTDQDNGIIFADLDGEAAEHAQKYFTTLGEIIVSGLEICGFNRCSGQVMANSSNWCQPLQGWKDSVESWVEQLDPKDIRNMTIFLDYRYLHGETALYENLKDYTTKLFKQSKHALLFMAEDDLRHRVPLNIFGNIITRRTGIKNRKLNLKSEVMVHLVDCIRLFALREGIWETNSFERIHRLKARGVFKPDDAEYIEAAFESLLMIRIHNTVIKTREGYIPDNIIDLGHLENKDKALLKETMLVVNRLQTLTDHAFYVHKA
jgi:CBS domain-containing protein